MLNHTHVHVIEPAETAGLVFYNTRRQEVEQVMDTANAATPSDTGLTAAGSESVEVTIRVGAQFK